MLETVARFVEAGRVAIACAGRTSPSFTPAMLLENLGGDTELFQRVTTLFRDNTPVYLAQMNEAIAQRDAVALEKSAHSLISSLVVFGAHHARDIARTLQINAQLENFDEAEKRFIELKNEADRVFAALASHSRFGAVASFGNGCHDA